MWLLCHRQQETRASGCPAMDLKTLWLRERLNLEVSNLKGPGAYPERVASTLSVST